MSTSTRHTAFVKAPQAEMPFAGDSFALITETAQDGERIARENSEEAERARRFQEAQQTLF